MSFARFASTTSPLTYRPPAIPKPVSKEPWGKKHRWLAHPEWICVPESVEADDDGVIWAGYMYKEDRPDAIYRGCGWAIEELELIED